MSSTGSREHSDQIPARGQGMTAYQKEKSKARAGLCRTGAHPQPPPCAGERGNKRWWGKKHEK